MSPFLYWYIGRRYNNWYVAYDMQWKIIRHFKRALYIIWSQDMNKYTLYCRVPLYKDNGL